MVDILFLAKGRKEFTEASWGALLSNTTGHVHVQLMTDGETTYVGTAIPFVLDVDPLYYGGPVACMNEFLGRGTSEFIAKIDNDTIIPPGWLSACLGVMSRYPEIDLLGLEPWAPDEKLWPEWVEPMVASLAGYEVAERRVRTVSHIGGIGVFRRSAFERFGKPTPNSKDGRYGFTEWQWANPSMVKAFLDPPLPVFLLDHLPMQPWLSLSMRYEQMGLQRRTWPFYDPIKHKALWDWWVK